MAHCNHRSRNSLLPHWLGLRAVSKQLRFVPLRTSNYRRTPYFDSRRLSSWQHYRRNGRDSVTTSCDHDDYMSIAATRFTFVCVLPRPLPFAPTCHPRWQDSGRDATPRRRWRCHDRDSATTTSSSHSLRPCPPPCLVCSRSPSPSPRPTLATTHVRLDNHCDDDDDGVTIAFATALSSLARLLPRLVLTITQCARRRSCLPSPSPCP